MNISYTPIHIPELPPAVQQLSHEFPKAVSYLLIPAELLYFSIYFKIKGFNRVYAYVAFLSLLSFWMYPFITPARCGPVRSLQHFASEYNFHILC
jgi:hypothetical protein